MSGGALLITISVLVLEYEIYYGSFLLLHQAKPTVEFDSKTASHANVRRQHSVDVSSGVHVWDVQQPLGCTSINGVALVHRLEKP